MSKKFSAEKLKFYYRDNYLKKRERTISKIKRRTFFIFAQIIPVFFFFNCARLNCSRINKFLSASRHKKSTAFNILILFARRGDKMVEKRRCKPVC